MYQILEILGRKRINISAISFLSILILAICAYIFNPTEKEMVRYINKTGIRTKPHKSGGTIWVFDGLSNRNNYIVFSTFRLIFGDTGPIDNIPDSKSWKGTKIYVGIFGLYFSVTPGICRLPRGKSYPRLHWEDDDFEWPYDKNGNLILGDN